MCLMSFFSQAVKATTITSIVCGSWSASSTWNLNRIPISTDTIIVNTFVAYDIDFTSVSPGFLKVTECGNLCGTHQYIGCFEFKGIVFLSQLHANYGTSKSYANVNVQQQASVTNGASYSVLAGSTCIGCTSQCKNCSVNNKQAAPFACSGLGIVVKSIRAKINLFPNPASEMLNLEYANFSGNAYFMILNSFGNSVKKGKIIFENGNSIINLFDLTQGIYLVKLSFEDEREDAIFRFNCFR